MKMLLSGSSVGLLQGRPICNSKKVLTTLRNKVMIMVMMMIMMMMMIKFQILMPPENVSF